MPETPRSQDVTSQRQWSPPRWCCRRCHAEQQQYRRARQSAQRAKKRVARILRLRLSAERLVEEAETLKRSFGGIQGLLEALTPRDRARLAIRYVETADDAYRKVQERERQAEIDLQDPRLLMELERMALDQARRYPHRVAEALRQADWTVEPPR